MLVFLARLFVGMWSSFSKMSKEANVSIFKKYIIAYANAIVNYKHT